jgi:spore coat protein CotH
MRESKAMRSSMFLLVATACGLGTACTSSSAVNVSGSSDSSAESGDAEAEAASDSDSDAGVEPSEDALDLYRPDHLLEVAVTLDPLDWDTIRAEGRSVNQVFSGCADPEFAYTEVLGSAVVDGQHLDDIAIRKKGFLGSLSDSKPSLRLVLDRQVPGQGLGEQKDLTFNNSRSDASLMRQCLAYGVFRAAGIPTPRCSLARVTVNDTDLGTYVNVEPVKKPFLRRHFEDPNGNLYEGNAGADFRAESLDKFEKKTHESDPDRSDLEALSDLLANSDDAELEQRLEELVDLDEFMRFWAVETLLGLWDGYTGNLNNFFVYHDPQQDRLSFLPWGPDAAFQRFHPFLPAGQKPAASYAWARLPRRLYAHEPTRRRYQEVLRELLQTVWNEETLLAEVTRLSELLVETTNAAAVDALRIFINARRAQIEGELANPDVPWSVPERPQRVCVPEANVPLRAHFVTQWSTLSASTTEGNTLELEIEGEEQVFEQVAVGAGLSPNLMGGAASNLLRLVATRADGSTLTLQFGLGQHPIEPGEIVMHGFETLGIAFQSGSVSIYGYVGEGRIIFDQASTDPGAPLEGSIEGMIVIPSRAQQAPAE